MEQSASISEIAEGGDEDENKANQTEDNADASKLNLVKTGEQGDD